MFYAVALVLFILPLYVIYRYYRFTARYPKGPTPWPIIGNFLDMDMRAQDEAYARLSKGFGGLCTIFFPFPVIHISDYKLIREAFIEKGDDFVDRPELRLIQIIRTFSQDGGVLNSNGDIWREQRRTAVSILRDFGMGKNVMEQLVNSTITEYLKELDKIEDKTSVNLRWPIQVMIANIINELLFGFRYTYEDCEPLVRYVEDLNQVFLSFGKDKMILLGMAFPLLNLIPYVRYHTNDKHVERARYVNQYIVDCVERAMKSYRPDEEPTCFVHAYKQRMAKNDRLDDPNMLSTCAEFFMAGQETTTTTLRWAALILTKHPEKQDRLREEILTKIGRDRLPSLSDQAQMPYARATILEVQRHANILRANALRMTTRDTEVGGHFIPKGAYVNADIHFLHVNDPLFVKPEEFRPERYLEADGVTLKKELVERTLPFSLGKRVCAGESLAKAELFLGLVSTIQHYRLEGRPDAPVDLESQRTFIRLPKDQSIILTKV